MKNKTFLLSLPLLTVLWLFACQKDPQQPPKPDPCPWPKITTEGLNTFGCKINGREWVPCVDFYGLAVGNRPIDCRLTESDGSNFLGLDTDYDVAFSDTIVSLGIGLKPLKEGAINFDDLEFVSFKFRLLYNGGLSSKEWYTLDVNNPRYFEIVRLDTAANIIAAKFNFSLVSEDKMDTLHFSEGRFDIKYYPQ